MIFQNMQLFSKHNNFSPPPYYLQFASPSLLELACYYYFLTLCNICTVEAYRYLYCLYSLYVGVDPYLLHERLCVHVCTCTCQHTKKRICPVGKPLKSQMIVDCAIVLLNCTIKFRQFRFRSILTRMMLMLHRLLIVICMMMQEQTYRVHTDIYVQVYATIIIVKFCFQKTKILI